MEPITTQAAYADSDHIKRDFKPLLKKLGITFVVLLIIMVAIAVFVWPMPQMRAAEKLEAVEAQFDANKLDEALTTVEGYLSDDPDNVQYLTAKALILAQKGSLAFKEEEFGAQAITVAQAAVAADPKNSEAYRALGYAYEIQEKYDEARSNYDTAFNLDPSNAYAIYGKAHTYDLQGDMIKAEEGYRFALLKNPNFDQAYVGLARALAAKGDAKGSLESLKQAFALSTNTHNKAESAYSIAYLSLVEGDLPTALTYAKDSTVLDPTYPLGWHIYGTVLFVDSFDKTKHPDAATRGKMIKESIAMQQKSLTLYPLQTAAYLQLGTQYSAIGAYNEAAESFRRGLIAVDKDITLSETDKRAMRDKLIEAQELLVKVQARVAAPQN